MMEVDKNLNISLHKEKKAKEMIEKELLEIKRKSEDRYKSMIEVLTKFLTPSQVKTTLIGPDWKKKIHWQTEDITSAISLHSVSAKAYKYLTNKCNLPLPFLSTLC